MYKRYASMAGDVTMVAPRRLLAQRMAGWRDNVYSYRWDVAALNSSTTIGVQHFAEVCSNPVVIHLVLDTTQVSSLHDELTLVSGSKIPFVFANPVQTITPLGSDPARLELGQMAARMWTSFVVDLDPNGHGG